MKIKTTIAALAATLLLPFGAAAADDALELLEAGVLSAATEGTYPPFSMRAPDGSLYSIEIRGSTNGTQNGPP